MNTQSTNQLTQAFLAVVCKSYFDNDVDSLERLNISKETAKILAELPQDTLHRLTKSKLPLISISLNETALNSSINLCVEKTNKNQDYDRAIQLGASKSMMKHLTLMSAAEFSERRKNLGMDEEKRVRPNSLSSDEEMELNRAYSSMPKRFGFDVLSELIFLSEKTGLAINRIFNYYGEYSSNS